MKTFAALLVTVAVALTGCSGEDGPTTAQDPASSSDRTTPPASAAAPPAAVPAAPGSVRTRTLATVMDTGGGPELCLGPIAESYPPQCTGPEIVGWDWKEQADHTEKQDGTRWGTFVVGGTWDGTSFTVADVIPGPLWDPVPEEPVDLPEPSVDHTPAELQSIATQITQDLPGVQNAYPDDEGHVLADVTYDDGTLQSYVDEQYGDGVVVVSGALFDV